ARHRGLLHQRVADPAGAVDEEQDRHLPVEGRVLGQLLLVAVLDLVVVLLDDAVDHVAREAADHGRGPGPEPGLVLPAPAQVDLSVPAAAVSGALGPETADPQRVPAAARTRPPGAESADAIGIAGARQRPGAAERRIDARAEAAGTEHARAGARGRTHLREGSDQAQLPYLGQVLQLLVGIGLRLARLRRRGLLLLCFRLADLALVPAALLALLRAGELLHFGLRRLLGRLHLVAG